MATQLPKKFTTLNQLAAGANVRIRNAGETLVAPRLVGDDACIPSITFSKVLSLGRLATFPNQLIALKGPFLTQYAALEAVLENSSHSNPLILSDPGELRSLFVAIASLRVVIHTSTLRRVVHLRSIISRR